MRSESLNAHFSENELGPLIHTYFSVMQSEKAFVAETKMTFERLPTILVLRVMNN